MTLLYQNPIFDKLTLLATCLCQTIVEEELPEPCFCGVIAGEEPSFDYITGCENEVCGMAWIRLATAAPTTGVGVVSEIVKNCGSTIGFEIEMGIVRCIGQGEDGGPTPPDEMLAAVSLQIADMYAMRKALMCCDGIGDFILDAYTPYGPQGLAVGGFWGATLTEV